MNRIKPVWVLLIIFSLGGQLGGMDFRRGDVNTDGGYNIADPIYLLNYMFGGGPSPDCLDTADINDDGMINLADALYGLAAVHPGFSGMPVLIPAPTSCGAAPSSDNIDCASYQHCP